MKNVITSILLSAMQIASFAATYTSTGSHNWTPTFPSTLSQNDTIIIRSSDTITLNYDVILNGVLLIKVNAVLDGSKNIKISTTGKLKNQGTINITQELHVDGKFINTFKASVKKLHSDGIINNSGTITLEQGEKFDHHGGELKGCGTIYVDVLKIHKNTGVNLNGNSSTLTTCQNFCNTAKTDTPTFSGVTRYQFINNTNLTNSVVDSTITFCSSPPALPVTLTSFDIAFDNQKNIQINWVTASELNNDVFEVERSLNTSNWQLVATVKGAGNSNKVINYTAYDRYPLSETSCYRLKQTDFDGTVTYSDIKSITIHTNLINKIVAFPNPAKSKITIKSKHINFNEVKITSLLCTELNLDINLLDDSNKEAIELDISKLKPGIYIVTFRNRTLRFIKES